MTKVTRLVLSGFKSFAKRTELLFGDGFNCVLGPNGSGKSNIMDAICFVLGKASAKALRAERLTSFIYNGGKTKQPAKQAEVSIYFDNSKKTFPSEDHEIKITRIARQNGQSVYKINDKVRTRQEILELLGVAKIDPDGYNIILQGDIVRFTEMPTVERRQLIEEIAGISIYEEKKHKAMLELDKVEGRLREAEILLKEKQANLDDLRKDRDTALKFKDMNDKIRQHQASYLKIQIDKREKERSELQKKIDSLQEQLGKINSKILAMQQENQEKRKQIEEISREIEEKGEKEQVELNRDVGNLKVELAKQQSRFEVCTSELEKIKARNADLEKSIAAAQVKISQLKQDKAELEKKKAGELRALQEYEGKIQKFKEKNRMEDAAAIEKEIMELEKVIDEQEKQAASMREEQHALLRDKDRVEFQIKTLDEKIQKVEAVEKDNKSKFAEVRQQRDEFKKATLELNKILDEDATLAKTLHAAKDRLDNLRDEVSKLIAKNIGIQESAASDTAAREILNQKGRIQGIHGTVAELGQASAKYSLSLEIAAGPRMRSIVVENDKVAAECIRYLKVNKLGIATFLPLNKLESRQTTKEVEELAKAKGSHGLALNLVQFDPKFSKVFNYIFANTIVVDSIDVARRLGIGKAKMVSLDGDVAEHSGIMQGGFRQKRTGSFQDKSLGEAIEKKQGELHELEQGIGKMEKRRDDIEKRIGHLRQFKANIEGDIIKAEKLLHLEAGDVDVSRKQKDELQAQGQQLDKKLRELGDKISALNRQLAQAKTKRQEMRSKVVGLRDPVLLAELRSFEEKKSQLFELSLKIDADIKNSELQIASLYEPEIEKARLIIRQLEKENASFGKEQGELQQAIKGKQQALKQKEAQVKEFSAKYRALFERRKKLEEEMHRNELAINSEQPESRSVEINMNNITFQRAELVGKLAALNEEFEQYHGIDIITSKTEEQLKSEISKFERLKADIERGGVNMKALEIYDSVERQYNELVDKKEKLVKEKQDVLTMMDEIEGRKKELFMKTLEVVTGNFKTIFSSLSTKGEVDLELENPEKPFEAGLDIKVRITGNKFLDIRGLSGGEKTMTALSFIFAIQENEPASFYILDEVDAALDRHNSEKFGKLIGKYGERAQYIIISHNDSVITEAHNLYGVSMDENGISNVVSLKL
ncbi:chromosome segregation protein SMC [Candidatus Woesearchaeota archaeon]|nr:chromosome segregation protein SMC [Candidatus Woesearchaeota archaeon]